MLARCGGGEPGKISNGKRSFVGLGVCMMSSGIIKSFGLSAGNLFISVSTGVGGQMSMAGIETSFECRTELCELSLDEIVFVGVVAESSLSESSFRHNSVDRSTRMCGLCCGSCRREIER